MTREAYKQAFPALQERLRSLQYQLLAAQIPTVIVFEGWDAAGKGTLIQRLSERLDPRAFRAHAGAPPSELEQRHHFLWRYQTRLPEDGHMALFDHSWYGRVLVERVEKWVGKKQWQPAYDQIAEFERWLVDDGQVLVKMFFHISQKEQRRRLTQMEKDARERWKVEKEDWRRNRRYATWVDAVEEMLARTHSAVCPWTIVEATDARHTRVAVFETLVHRMQAALDHRQAAPAEVSRTNLAHAATHAARVERQQHDLERQKSVAEAAGLPLEAEA